MKCEDCKFWQRDASPFHQADYVNTLGVCRRSSPSSNNYWPQTEDKAWCGEFKKRRSQPGVDK